LSKGGIFMVHDHELRGIVDRGRENVDFAFALHLDDVPRRKLVRNVDVAALEEGASCRCGGHDTPDDALRLRQRSGFPTIETYEAYRVRCSIDDLIGAAAAHVGFGPFQPPGIVRGRVLLDQLGIENVGNGKSEIRQQLTVEAVVVDPERVLVHNDGLRRIGERAGTELESGIAAGRDRAVKRPFDILRRDRRTIVKGCVPAQPEGDRVPALVPFFGEFRRWFGGVGMVDAVRAGFGNEEQRAACRLRCRKMRHRKTCQSRRYRPKKLSPSDCHPVMPQHKDPSGRPVALPGARSRPSSGL
jgi:hypothetical protein